MKKFKDWKFWSMALTANICACKTGSRKEKFLFEWWFDLRGIPYRRIS